FNFLKYDQNMPNIPAGIGFQSFTGPALYAKVVRSINREWAAQATINRSPGKTSSSDSVNIQKGDYAWLFLTGEATYFPPQWKFSKKNSFFNEFGVQAGLQYHSIPFFARSSTTDATASSVETNSVLMAAVGATSVLHYKRYWLFEAFLRYQHPLQSGSLYDIDPKFAFDGSHGVIYKWKANWRLGDSCR